MGRRGRAAALAAYTGGVVAWAFWLAWLPARLDAAPAGPPLLAAAALTYRAAGFVCHQDEDRSFRHGRWPWAVCARCAGLYAGGALGAVGVAAAGVRRRRRGAVLTYRQVRAGLLLAALPTAVTWLAEHAGGAGVPITWRAAAAIPLGAGISAVIAHLVAGGSIAERAPSGVH